MKNYDTYQTLRRPTWTPPAWLFAPVWTVLYAIIIASYGFVIYQFFNAQLSFIILLPFILNIIFNILFTPIQFGLKNNILATIDILLVLGTLIWALIGVWPHMQWVTLVNIPYLVWVMFATVLEITVTVLNR